MEYSTSTLFVNGDSSRDRARMPEISSVLHATHGATEEALVADARAGLTPAQMVEHKLATLLKSQPLPVSHLMTAKRTSRNQ